MATWHERHLKKPLPFLRQNCYTNDGFIPVSSQYIVNPKNPGDTLNKAKISLDIPSEVRWFRALNKIPDNFHNMSGF